MEKIDEKSTKPATPPANNNNAKPDTPAGGDSQPKTAPQPKKPDNGGSAAPAQE